MSESSMTVEMLKARKRCCNSGCLHCPYGYTVKKFGIQFKDYDEGLVIEVMKDLELNQSVLESFEKENIKLIFLKEFLVGVMTKNHIIVKDLYLKKSFAEQGLEKPLIESYYFC